MIMVDEVRVWPHARPPFHKGSAHLTTSGADLHELHIFAERIGLSREWFQEQSSPHYDVTPAKRETALRAGAIFVPAKEQAKRRIAHRAAK